MKRSENVVVGGRCLAALLLVLGAWGTGCGKTDPSGPEASAGSTPAARGEPIRGEAIQPPPTPSGGATQEVAAVPAPATPEKGASPAAAPSPTQDLGAKNSGTAASPLTVGFDKLASFQYALPEGPVDTNTVATVQASAQIPVTIQALNNQFVSLKGFMLPLKVEKGLVTELLIMRDQSMCCYGTVPKINEWVSVKMVGGGVKPVMDQAVTLFGKLKVGEMYENGYLVGIYAMDGERMAGPLDM